MIAIARCIAHKVRKTGTKQIIRRRFTSLGIVLHSIFSYGTSWESSLWAAPFFLALLRGYLIDNKLPAFAHTPKRDEETTGSKEMAESKSVAIIGGKCNVTNSNQVNLPIL